MGLFAPGLPRSPPQAKTTAATPSGAPRRCYAPAASRCLGSLESLSPSARSASPGCRCSAPRAALRAAACSAPTLRAHLASPSRWSMPHERKAQPPLLLVPTPGTAWWRTESRARWASAARRRSRSWQEGQARPRAPALKCKDKSTSLQVWHWKKYIAKYSRSWGCACVWPAAA